MHILHCSAIYKIFIKYATNSIYTAYAMYTFNSYTYSSQAVYISQNNFINTLSTYKGMGSRDRFRNSLSFPLISIIRYQAIVDISFYSLWNERVG